MSNYCDSLSQYFCIITTSYWEFVVFIVCCHFISLYYLPREGPLLLLQAVQKALPRLFLSFCKDNHFFRESILFQLFFSLFSLPCLSHLLSWLSHSLPWFCCHIPLSNVCRQLLSDSTSQWTPLLLAIQFPLLGLVRDLHPLDNAHAERTNKEALSGLPYMESAVCVCMTGCWRIILCCPTARWFLCRKMIFGNSVSLIKSFSIYGSSVII